MNDLSLRIWSYNLEGATVTKFRQKCSEVERGKPHERETQTYGRGTFPEESRTRDEAQMYFAQIDGYLFTITLYVVKNRTWLTERYLQDLI